MTTRYTYDGDDILREARGSATLPYVHGPGIDEPLAVSDGATRTYFHADGLGSIVAMTDPAGNVTSRRQYDARHAPPSLQNHRSLVCSIALLDECARQSKGPMAIERSTKTDAASERRDACLAVLIVAQAA